MEPRREKLSDLLHGSALPPPPTKRALVYGTIAAIIGAFAIVMAARTHGIRVGHMAAGIGVLVGVAIIRRGGYGKKLALLAATITALAIPTAYYATFWLQATAWCNPSSHAGIKENAEKWAQLEAPTDEQVFAFARDEGFPFTNRQAFDHYPGEMLTWFHQNQPTLEEWIDWELADSEFGEYLTYSTGTIDYVLLAVALLVAAGIVMMRTAQLEDRAKQKAIARRQEAAQGDKPA